MKSIIGRNERLGLMMLVMFGVFGCEEPVSSSESHVLAEVPTFTQVEALLFERGCAEGTCHGGPSPQAGLNLEAGFAFDALVNQPCSMPGAVELGLNLVTPGEPDDSFLYVKVTLTENDPHLGSPMPTYGSGLSIEDTELIRLWIEAGAKRD
jgi:hypothetical protein